MSELGGCMWKLAGLEDEESDRFGRARRRGTGGAGWSGMMPCPVPLSPLPWPAEVRCG